MNLPKFCINRPAFTVVISLVLVILGILGWSQLSVRWVPNINPPSLSISTEYPGASARSVEQEVTKVLESALSGIDGITSLSSSSHRGRSQIDIEFNLGTNMNAALEEVRGSIERVRNLLPKETENPMVNKANANNQPILYLSFYHPLYDQQQLSDYVRKYVAPIFETIDGVALAPIMGERISAMRISLYPEKMASAHLSLTEVMRTLSEQHASVPSGEILAKDRSYGIIVNTALKTPAEFNQLIMRHDNQHTIRLNDIGEASLEPEREDSAFRINGKTAVAMAIIPQSMANPLVVEAEVQKRIKQLKRTLPAQMKLTIEYNQAEYIRASIESVYEALIEALFFVWLINFIFLGHLRATLIPIVTIPVCLISTFAVIYFLGFSINTITLMALVLAIGLVVDDAIVMLENIKRHIESGSSALSAALIGSREIIFPVIAMTLTLAAVYTPIAFTPGLLGVLFREFTFTLAAAVIISGVVALTLSPMMCAKMLKKNLQLSTYERKMQEQLHRLQIAYQRSLSYLLKKRHWVLLGLMVIGFGGILLYRSLPAELAPAEDQDELYMVAVGPRNASFHYSDYYVRQLEAIFSKMPEIQSYVSIIGMNNPAHSFLILSLVPKEKRIRSTAEVMASLSAATNDISGLRTHVIIPPPALIQFAGNENGERLAIAVKTSQDYDQLQLAVNKLMKALKEDPQFTDVDNRLKWDSEQFSVEVDRERAADLNVSLPTITETLSTLLAGKRLGKIEDMNIIVRLNKEALANPNIFSQLYVENKTQQMVPLSHLIQVVETIAPDVYRHVDRMRADIIFFNLAPGVALADAIGKLETLAKENLSDQMQFSFSGEAKRFIDSQGKTLFTFFLALVFIYLVLVAQFESFIDPFIILLTVPFALVGAFLSLKLGGGTLNIYSNIGLVTLIGLIAKHGILMTDFANHLQRTGLSVEHAIIEAASLRLRPILMTTAAMVLGALPLALASGPGAESREQIGLVIAGGLLLGTLFSLVIVPISYTYLSPLRKFQRLSEEKE